MVGNMNRTNEYLSFKVANVSDLKKKSTFYTHRAGTQNIYSGLTKSAKLKV